MKSTDNAVMTCDVGRPGESWDPFRRRQNWPCNGRSCGSDMSCRDIARRTEDLVATGNATPNSSKNFMARWWIERVGGRENWWARRMPISGVS